MTLAALSAATTAAAQPAGTFPASLDPATIDGTNGFVINGVLASDSIGETVSGAGDLNNDGIMDILLGSNFIDRSGLNDVGEAYVIFGKPYDAAASFELSALNGSNGFSIRGQVAGDNFAGFVSNAGDVNGDTIDDIIIGALASDPSGNQSAGRTYVIFGSALPFGSSFNLNALNGTNGLSLLGIDPFDQSGRRVSNAGDINDDGVDDLLIAAPSADPASGSNAGECYVVYGTSSGFPSQIFLSTLNGSNGFVMPGVSGGDNLGLGLGYAGDFNNDGIDDIALGAPSGDPPGTFNAGEVYVLFGSSAGFGSTFALGSLNGSNGIRIDGNGSQAGNSVSTAGDFNGDGIDDLIVGSYRSGPGAAYVVFGSDSALPASLNLGALDGTNGIELLGIAGGDEAGISVKSAGDINDDGFDDVIIGAWFADSGGESNSGEAYVVFGTDQSLPASLNLADLDGSNGFTITGVDADDLTGVSVSALGDVSGDGIDDLIVGARGGDPGNRSSAGECYVIFGRATECIPDTNNDGALTPADFTAWIAAFNAMAPKCDQNADGLCTPADFTAWIANFNAGC